TTTCVIHPHLFSCINRSDNKREADAFTSQYTIFYYLCRTYRRICLMGLALTHTGRVSHFRLHGLGRRQSRLVLRSDDYHRCGLRSCGRFEQSRSGQIRPLFLHVSIQPVYLGIHAICGRYLCRSDVFRNLWTGNMHLDPARRIRDERRSRPDGPIMDNVSLWYSRLGALCLDGYGGRPIGLPLSHAAEHTFSTSTYLW